MSSIIIVMFSCWVIVHTVIRYRIYMCMWIIMGQSLLQWTSFCPETFLFFANLSDSWLHNVSIHFHSNVSVFLPIYQILNALLSDSITLFMDLDKIIYQNIFRLLLSHLLSLSWTFLTARRFSKHSDYAITDNDHTCYTFMTHATSTVSVSRCNFYTTPPTHLYPRVATIK